MSQSTYGNETLPTDGNVAKGNDADTAAMVTALQNLSKRIQYGAGAPTASVSTPSIYLRTNGDSTNSVCVNLGGNTWQSVAISADPS